MDLDYSAGLLDAAKKSRTSICRKCLSPLSSSLPRVRARLHRSPQPPFLLIFSALRDETLSRIPSVHHARSRWRKRKAERWRRERRAAEKGNWRYLGEEGQMCCRHVHRQSSCFSRSRRAATREGVHCAACSCMVEMDVECMQQRKQLRWKERSRVLSDTEV